MKTIVSACCCTPLELGECHLELETRGKFDTLVNERSYPGGVPSCKVICLGTDNLGYVWCLFSTGVTSLGVWA